MSSNDKSKQSKRKMIKALATGGAITAIPTEWVKPVLHSAILPAHAQTSGVVDDGCYSINAGGWDYGSSMSMRTSGEFDLACSGKGQTSVLIKNSSGATVCQGMKNDSGSDPISFSCRYSASVGSFPSAGDIMTVVATQDGGCSCMTTFTISDEE